MHLVPGPNFHPQPGAADGARQIFFSLYFI